MQIYRAPKLLILSLKRFKEGTDRQGRPTNVKNESDIDFGLKLSMPIAPDDNGKPRPNVEYELYAIITHFGTMNSGHYTAFAKSFNPPGSTQYTEKRPTDNKWFYFDDDRVTVIPDMAEYMKKDTKILKAAYVLFYRQKNYANKLVVKQDFKYSLLLGEPTTMEGKDITVPAQFAGIGKEKAFRFP
jgi:ubiquitin C-terminal hydrolase